MVICKKWVLSTPVIGEPTLDNFKLVEEELPPCQEGELLLEAEYLTVDPYMRYMARTTSVGQSIVGYSVCKVIESKYDKYPVGSYVIGNTKWTSHVVVNESDFTQEFGFTSLPDIGSEPNSAALGILGMPGNTAYFGFLEICNPQPGETVLVNGAAGAVGSAVCQIAKIKGCKVIAFAGSESKVSWLKELGIDHVYNYKTTDVTSALTKAAPEGINCYFDNVGGEFTGHALSHMCLHGRISVCGAISTYNQEHDTSKSNLKSPFNEGTIIWKQLKIEGFIVRRWVDRWLEGIAQMKSWIDQGKLKYKETITEGFENMPKAFIGLFNGDNIGKAIIKV